MSGIVAIVPLRLATQAKSRLAGLLDPGERATLAALMARDVIAALQGARGIDAVLVAAADEPGAALAREAGCRVLVDEAAGGLRAGVQAALDTLAREGVPGVLVVPADLPALTAADVTALLALHRPGLTLVPAARDGGTNALLLTPPDAVPCQFGPDSARRHLEAAASRGVHAASRQVGGFAHDLDTEDDVAWLCGQAAGGAALEFLRARRIPARLARTTPLESDDTAP